jgi:glycerophosphoryl diester phosphodiesterase
MSRHEVIKLFINQYFNIFDLKTPCVQVPISFKGITIVNKRFVNLVHEQNKKIHVWTVDSQDQMQSLINLGVDGIMTDRPSLLKDTLIKNNLWI